jgi:hypothetical protein
MQGFERIRAGRLAVVMVWVLLWLAAIDIGVNLAFGPSGKSFPGLRKYFEYGRSVEGKLARTMAADPKKEGLILEAGWLDPEPWKGEPDRRKEGSDLMVAAYGQSFTMHALRDASQMDPRITMRAIGGPAAPPNHSYAAYKLDEPLRKVDVVVFGILSSSVADIGSMSGLIWHFENPAPFTFPRYRLSNGQLTEELPVLGMEAEFRSAFGQRSPVWQKFKQQLRRSDRGYDPLVFEETIADRSSIVRLIRRGWVAQQQAYESGVYDTASGFNADSEDVKVLQALVVDLARRTSERGERLVVLLLHARGHSDHLYKVMEGTLKQHRIDYVSTHTLFSANDPSNFKYDGHYMPATNAKLTQALLSTLRSTPPARKPASPKSNGAVAEVPHEALATVRQ